MKRALLSFCVCVVGIDVVVKGGAVAAVLLLLPPPLRRTWPSSILVALKPKFVPVLYSP